MQSKAFMLTLTAGPVSNNACTLTATLSENGTLPYKSPVMFFTSGSALFSNDQTSITTETNVSGVATAILTDSVSETVTVTAVATGAGVSDSTSVTFSSGAASSYTRPHLREATGSGENVSLSTSNGDAECQIKK